jgi:hypothetical protein
LNSITAIEATSRVCGESRFDQWVAGLAVLLRALGLGAASLCVLWVEINQFSFQPRDFTEGFFGFLARKRDSRDVTRIVSNDLRCAKNLPIFLGVGTETSYPLWHSLSRQTGAPAPAKPKTKTFVNHSERR